MRTVAWFLAGLFAACRRDPTPPATVVFVCEHGSAKSVVAAAQFEARARARDLPYHALARGVTPDPSIADSARAGLAADGLAPTLPVPVALGRADVARAARVVAFGPLPRDLAGGGGERVERWDEVPPVGRDYAAARDAMVARIDALLDQLAGERRGDERRAAAR
jgi:arsenate reductase (thioredoxin)